MFRPGSGRVRAAPRRARQSYPGPRHSGPFNDSESKHDWEISITGDLTDKQHDLIDRLIEVPRRSRGYIFFDSGGGSAYVGLALASVIRLRGLKATAIVASECSSAAILPFAACERRFVTPHAALLFHPIRWSSEEEIRLEEAAEWARHFAILEKDLDRLVARMLNFSEEKLEQWTRPGRFVTGQEMVDNGLAELVDLFSGDVWSQIATSPRSSSNEKTQPVKQIR